MTSDTTTPVSASGVPTARRQVDDDLFLDASATSDAVTRSELAVAQVDLATGRVVAVSDAVETLFGGPRRTIVGRLVTDFIEGEPTGALPLLATGRVDGFEAQRRLRRNNGEILEAYVWAHVLGLARPARYGAVFITEQQSPPSHELGGPSSDQRVIGTVDDEWRIDRISHEAEVVLGYQAPELTGAALLSAISPLDLPELLAGLAHVHATGRNAVVRLRVRRADRTWLWCRARLAALGNPPRFAFSLRPLVDSTVSSAERVSELERRLARIAHEIRSVGLPLPSASTPVLADMPELATLTSREWETLSLLAEGGRVPSIAATLGLSQSTVRNHLSAIFRKVNVGSQAELLARLQQSR
ncbi:MAG: LuxR C-terminal-related transcriptional regulator [Actinomycetes bacterium]